MTTRAPTNFTTQFPELGTGPIDVGPYRDPDYFEREKAAVFARTWLVAGRDSQIPNPGDYFVRDVPTFDLSLIFVRGKDGQIRGFFNACRHRGNHLCVENSGNLRAFTCKFHGWSYNLHGELAGVPDEESFFDLNKSQLNLIPVSTDMWQGFIFFNLESEPDQSLEQHLGEFGEALAGYPFHEGSARYQFRGEIKANWKSMVDSFTEIYHVPFLHKCSISDTLAGPENPLGRLLDIRLYGPHKTSSITSNKNYKPWPVQGIAYEFAQSGAVTGGQGTKEGLPPGVNPTKKDDWGLDVNVIFPTFLPVIGPGMYFTHQMWPVAVDRTVWEMTGFVAPARTAADRFIQEYFLVELRDAVLEDMNTVERVQSSINAGVINEFHYQDNEIALRHQNHVVNKCLNTFESRVAAE